MIKLGVVVLFVSNIHTTAVDSTGVVLCEMDLRSKKVESDHPKWVNFLIMFCPRGPQSNVSKVCGCKRRVEVFTGSHGTGCWVSIKSHASDW